MRTPWLFFLATLFSGVAVPVHAEASSTGSDNPDKAITAPNPRPRAEKKVFTNEDLEQLAAKAPTPAAGEAPPQEAAVPSVESATATSSAINVAQLEPYVKEKDPWWYAEQLAPLRAELAQIDSEIRRLRAFRATGYGMMSGLVLDQPSLRLTPENEIAQLSLQRRELQHQVDELADTARRNAISPGFLLPASPYLATLPAPPRPRLAPQQVDELEKQGEEAETHRAQQIAHLGVVKEEAELAERDYALFRQQFYSNPGYASDDKGRFRLAALAGQIAAKREEVSAAQENIDALEQGLETLARALGPQPAAPLPPELQREAWQERLRPLREELARVQAELARMRAGTRAQGMTLYPETSSGSPTSILLRRLQTQAVSLRQQIESIEDEAQRAGAPPGWLR